MQNQHQNRRSRILRLLRLKKAKWRKRSPSLVSEPTREAYAPTRRIRHQATPRSERRELAQRR
jgi:hypothetical protein